MKPTFRNCLYVKMEMKMMIMMIMMMMMMKPFVTKPLSKTKLAPSFALISFFKVIGF